MQKDGKNFIVGLSLNFQHDGLVVNSIRGLYPKDLHEWLTWIQDGKTLYLNKEKVQNLIAQQRRDLADVSYLDLNSINNIIQNFENPSVSSKNPENSSGEVQFSKAGDLQTEQESKKQKNSTVAKSSTGLSQPFPDYRGLTGDEKLIASAALQYVEHITNIAPSNNIVNRAIGEIKKFLEKIKDGQHLSVNNFIINSAASLAKV